MYLFLAHGALRLQTKDLMEYPSKLSLYGFGFFLGIMTEANDS